MTTPMPEPRWGKTYGLTPDIWAWSNSSDGVSVTLEVWPGHEAQAKEMLQAMCDMYGRTADIRANDDGTRTPLRDFMEETNDE